MVEITSWASQLHAVSWFTSFATRNLLCTGSTLLSVLLVSRLHVVLLRRSALPTPCIILQKSIPQHPKFLNDKAKLSRKPAVISLGKSSPGGNYGWFGMLERRYLKLEDGC